MSLRPQRIERDPSKYSVAGATVLRAWSPSGSSREVHGLILKKGARIGEEETIILESHIPSQIGLKRGGFISEAEVRTGTAPKKFIEGEKKKEVTYDRVGVLESKKEDKKPYKSPFASKIDISKIQPLKKEDNTQVTKSGLFDEKIDIKWAERQPPTKEKVRYLQTYESVDFKKDPLGYTKELIERSRFKREVRKNDDITFSGEFSSLVGGLASGFVSVPIDTASFITKVVTSPVDTSKEVIKSVGELIKSPREVLSREFKKSAKDPAFFSGRVLGEIATAKGLGRISSIVGRGTEIAKTRVSPLYLETKKLKTGKKGFEIPSKSTETLKPIKITSRLDDLDYYLKTDPTISRFKKTKEVEIIKSPSYTPTPIKLQVITTTISKPKVEIQLASGVKSTAESIPKQITLAGKEDILAVSGARDFFTKFKKEIIIDKPLPSPLSPQIERSFFADPRGRLRASRLGLSPQKEASILDIITGDFTFKKSKPQAIYFEKTQIEKFPKSLYGLEKKLRMGKITSEAQLTPIEKEKLLKFQLTPSGKFKPLGFISSESEITLAPSEIVRRTPSVKKYVTIIGGRRVELISAEIVKTDKVLDIMDQLKITKTNKKLSDFEMDIRKSYEISRKPRISPVSPLSPLISKSGSVIYKGMSRDGISSPLLANKYPFYETKKGNGYSPIRPIRRNDFSPVYNLKPIRYGDYKDITPSYPSYPTYTTITQKRVRTISSLRPALSLDFKDRRIRKKKKVTTTRKDELYYSPDFTANILKIERQLGKEARGKYLKQTFTGLEIRPIIK